MIESPISPKLKAYLDAVKNNSPDTDRLRQEWRDDALRNAIDGIGERLQEARNRVDSKEPYARGEKHKLYESLKADYRECMRLAKTISDIKKRMREEP